MANPDVNLSHEQMVDRKLAEQERWTRELESRVRQLELLARARGLIPPERSGEHPATPPHAA